VLVLGCFKFVSYSLLGRASIGLFGLRELNSVLEPIAYRAGKITKSLCPVLQGDMPWLLLPRSWDQKFCDSETDLYLLRKSTASYWSYGIQEKGNSMFDFLYCLYVL